MTPEQQRMWNNLSEPTAYQRLRYLLEVIKENEDLTPIDPTELNRLIREKWLNRD